jgi:hypothetical protein
MFHSKNLNINPLWLTCSKINEQINYKLLILQSETIISTITCVYNITYRK